MIHTMLYVYLGQQLKTSILQITVKNILRRPRIFSSIMSANFAYVRSILQLNAANNIQKYKQKSLKNSGDWTRTHLDAIQAGKNMVCREMAKWLKRKNVSKVYILIQTFRWEDAIRVVSHVSATHKDDFHYVILSDFREFDSAFVCENETFWSDRQ